MGLLDEEFLGSGVNELGGGTGVAPYGMRHDSIGVKGKGWFGPLKNKNGTSTEISTSDESGDYPLLVPTLSQEQMAVLLNGQQPTEDIYSAARKYADQMRSNGKSPYYEGQGIYYPTPGIIK